MKLIALPAFADNYIWMVQGGREALVVDPGDAHPVRQALREASATLAAILVTHHHPDHTGGIVELRAETGARVIGPASERIAGITEPVRGGDRVLALDLAFDVIDVPGHTAGHVAYWCADLGGEPVLFCGDTLFSAGCGRLFEGTPAQMFDSLRRLAALPGSTRVCCTHEYTLANLRFARAVEPGNPALQAHQARCEALRASGQPTLPSTLSLERAINPFLRTDQPEPAAAARQRDPSACDPLAVFTTLRSWKNEFR